MSNSSTPALTEPGDIPVTIPAPPDKQTRWHDWGLALGCLVLYLAGAGGFDLLTDDELRYAEAGRRMVETGDWIIPEYNGVPRYQKPILFYWLQALSFTAFGVSAWAARVPAALAAIGVVLLTARLGRALWGPRAGLWAGIALAVSVQVLLLARMVMTDVVLLLFIQGALACFCFAQLVADDARKRRCHRWMYFCLGLGVLTKGPVALVLPAAVLGPWLIARRELKRTLREMRLLEGAAIVFFIAAPWYMAAHVHSDGDFTRHFFLHENLGRFASTVNTHPQPLFFYLLLLIPMTFPWTGIVPQAIRAGTRAQFRGTPFREAVCWLFLWQMAFVIVLFTFSGTKVWTYTLPAFPPLALLVGRWLSQQMEAAPANSPLRVPLLLFAVATVALAAGLHFLPLEQLPPEVRSAELLGALRLSLWLLAALSVFLLLIDRWLPLQASAAGLAGTAAVWYLALFLGLIPVLDHVWRQPLREVAERLRSHPEAMTITYHVHELGLNFHAGVRQVHHWREAESLPKIKELLAGERPVFVLIDPRQREQLEGARFHVWGETARFVYGANVRPPGAKRQAD